jgi:hypothetical protein
MGTVTESVNDNVRLDFRMACLELERAERAVLAADTVSAQEWVRHCRDQLDAILDMWNDSRTGRR